MKIVDGGDRRRRRRRRRIKRRRGRRRRRRKKEEEEEDSILQSKYIHPSFVALTGSVTANTNLLRRFQFF